MSSLPENAVWFVTGCSSGIGAALSRQIAALQPAVRLVATARNPASLSYLPDSPNILKLALDTTNPSTITTALDTTLSKFGRIDVLVNNAGYGLYGDTESLTEEQMRMQMETNFWGAVQLTKEAVRIFREVNPKDTATGGGKLGGVVVQVSSIGGRVAFPGGALYHASKFALEGFSESFSKELSPSWNIKFLLLEPAGTATEYAKGSMVHAPPHPAYTDPSCPTRQLEAYMSTPGVLNTWADPALVAGVVVDVVRGPREDVPLRLVTGSDGYALVHAAEEARLSVLEKWRSVTEKCSPKEQADAVAFLKSATE